MSEIKKNMDLREKTKLLTLAVILVIVILSWFGFKTDWVVDLFGILIIGLVTSAVAGTLIGSLGGEFLKKYSFTFEVWKFKFSVTAFFIVIILVKLFLFK